MNSDLNICLLDCRLKQGIFLEVILEGKMVWAGVNGLLTAPDAKKIGRLVC